MSNPTPPSWWQTQLAGLEKWGLLHWTYIATFLVGLVIGAVIF
jgi:hypothetical protein